MHQIHCHNQYIQIYHGSLFLVNFTALNPQSPIVSVVLKSADHLSNS